MGKCIGKREISKCNQCTAGGVVITHFFLNPSAVVVNHLVEITLLSFINAKVFFYVVVYLSIA